MQGLSWRQRQTDRETEDEREGHGERRRDGGFERRCPGQVKAKTPPFRPAQKPGTLRVPQSDWPPPRQDRKTTRISGRNTASHLKMGRRHLLFPFFLSTKIILPILKGTFVFPLF